MLRNRNRNDLSNMGKKRISLTDFIRNLTQKTENMTIRIFHFNPIQVNTLVLHDDTGEALIVDPGNCQSYEDAQLKEYVLTHQLKVVGIVNTHPHIDHIAGNNWCAREFNAPVWCHEAGMPIYNKSYAYAMAFGLSVDDMPAPAKFLHEGDEVCFGAQRLQVLYTPGHCDGSISLYSAADNFVICGDLIFEGSVGRSDLPTGSHALLVQMIQEKIFTLPDDTVIYPGHGPNTTVGYEKTHNPFL